MRLLLDENMPRPSHHFLQQVGYDVLPIGSELVGKSDQELMLLAIRQHRIIVTFDSDFGELVHKSGYRPLGIIYFRWTSFEPLQPGKFLHEQLERDELAFADRITIVGHGYIRQRLLKEQ